MDGLPDYIGSHDLVISYGDCELFGICVCGEWFGSIRPDGQLDNLASKWEHHVMTKGYPCPVMRREHPGGWNER